MMTRKDYVESRITFAEYYRAIYKEAGISYVGSEILPRVRQALEKGDEHLNSIPLAEWDSRSFTSERALRPVFKAHGDFYSLSGAVCAHKQAARDAAEGLS